MTMSTRKLTIPLLALFLSFGLVSAFSADESEKESKKMAMIHLLIRAGKTEEAAKAMRSLYPKGPPAGAAALEYYKVIGNSAKGWEVARQGLEKLSRANPDKLGYQLALAQVLTMRPTTLQAGMQMFSELAKRPNADNRLALEAWREVLLKLDTTSGNIGWYREYLALDPNNGAVRDALADAQRSEAKHLPWQLRDKADAQITAGHPREAIATLKHALQLDPRNAWVRFDLARLYHKQGDKKRGRVLMEEGLSAAPGDADMLYADALYVSLLGEAENALHLMDQIPESARSPSMQRLRQKMAIQAQTQQAQAYAREGRLAEMQSAMEHAEADAGDDAEYAKLVANAWVDMQNPDRAMVLMQRLATKPSAPIAARLYYAEILNRTERDEKLAALLKALSSSKKLSDDDKKELSYLKSSLAARHADNARHDGDLAGARAALAPALKEDPSNTDLLMALARVHSAAHESQEACDIYRQILQRTPDYLSARRALAWELTAMGDKAAAQKEMQTVLMSAPGDDVSTRLSVAEWDMATGDVNTARAIVEPLKNVSPDDQRVLLALGTIAKAEGNYAEALGYFKQAGAKDEITAIEHYRAGGYVATGVDFLSKTDGTPGISNLRAMEIPMEIRVPAGYSGGLAFVQIDPVNADAGTLDLSDLFDLRQYGKVQALAPNGAGITTLAQSARGTAVAAGFEGNGLRVDVGSTPVGFPVSDVVGGVKWSHYTEVTGFSFDLSRRPVTSSLLSYAGARDPVTGEIWGGVRSTGVSLHVSRDVGRLSGSLDLGYYSLTGMNVLTNAEYTLRTALDWSFVSKDDMRLTAGLAFTNWHYREDLRYYTFGQGGYYSPQRYYSLGIPFRWAGRQENWSYLLQGSWALTSSYEKDMPYYPTDPALQAQGNPVFTGGSSHGTGYSLTGAVERRLSPRLFAGARFEIDRSAYYAPNFAIVYLRYMFDVPAGSIPYPPSPVRPYSRY